MPNPLTEAAGLCIAFIRRSRFVLELRDLPEDSLFAAGFRAGSRLWKWVVRYYEYVYRRADLLGVTYPFMTEQISQAVPETSNRTVLIPHGVSFARFANANGYQLRARLEVDDRLVVLYAGSFSWYYGPSLLLDAASQLRHRSDIVMLLIGAGPLWQAIRDELERTGADNVHLLEAVPPDRLADVLDAADVYVSVTLTGRKRSFVTTKICDYLAMGRPILAVEKEQQAGPLLEGIEAGYRIPADRPEKLAECIEHLADTPILRQRMGDNARRYAETNLARTQTMEQFVSVLRKWNEACSSTDEAIL